VTCGAPVLATSLSNACIPAGCSNYALVPGVCKNIMENGTLCPNPGGVTYALTMDAPKPDGGSCAPIAKTDVPPPAWALAGRACSSAFAPGQADCPAGSICAPKPASPYQASVCIVQQGDASCPTLGYTSKHLLYTGVDDKRGCTPTCTCGAASGADCAGVLSVTPPSGTSMPTCSGAGAKYTLPFQCQGGFGGNGDFLLTLTPSGGSCTPPTQATPTGAAAASGPVTFCCTP
jgi:hypothetical protein